MTSEELINKIRDLINQTRYASRIHGVYAHICEILKEYGGRNNAFLDQVQEFNPRKITNEAAAKNIRVILESFIQYIESGLLKGISPERQAQLDVVSDFLEQANSLLNDNAATVNKRVYAG